MGSIGSGIDPTKLALGVEVNKNNGSVDIGKMVAGGVDFVLARASDGYQLDTTGGQYDMGTYVDDQFSANVDKAYRAGVPLFAVHNFRPDTDIYQAGSPESDWQYKGFKHAMRNKVAGKSFHGIVLRLYDTGRDGYRESNVFVKGKLETFYAWILKDPQFSYQGTPVPILFMMPISLIEASTELVTWLASQGRSKDLVMVQPVPMSNTPATWDTLKNTHIPALNFPIPTPGHATWKMVQWAKRYTGMEGTQYPPALHFFNGTPTALVDWLRFTPAVITPEPPVSNLGVYASNVDDLRIRKTPDINGEVVGKLKEDERVEMLETKNVTDARGYVYTWGRHERGWTALSVTWNYMRKV